MAARGFCTCKRDFPGRLTFHPPEGAAWHYLCDKPVLGEPAQAAVEYHGVTCSHPHNLPYNDECNVWWLRGTPDWQRAHTNLPAPRIVPTGTGWPVT